jgi:hypothetical protein
MNEWKQTKTATLIINSVSLAFSSAPFAEKEEERPDTHRSTTPPPPPPGDLQLTTPAPQRLVYGADDSMLDWFSQDQEAKVRGQGNH